ncbi:MAG TPA: ATP phosphoribosyltransferase regulatory subunit [Firmicutes bacterium]|nr:ATP phosphoribosyltransferase regulatory subunit [Bacillota bacterium]
MEQNRVQLPQGVRDLGPGEAAAHRELLELWGRSFERRGYREVVPPTFEFYSTFACGFAGREGERVFRFFDRQGRILALRSDFTAQVARLAATKLAEEVRPLRLWYGGPVFRLQEARNGYQTEFTQAGVELIGAAGAAADAEVVALALTALEGAGLAGTRVSLGHTGFLRALLADLEMNAEERAAVVAELTRRNLVGVGRILSELQVSEGCKEALCRLPQLFGGREVLAAGRQVAGENKAAQTALSDLAAIAACLTAQGVARGVTFDLGLVRELDYYTGMVFEAYVPGFGYPLGGGGRYDNLLERFGAAEPATGFALGVERVLAARERQRSGDQRLQVLN